jgi:porphobilinogen synthase
MAFPDYRARRLRDHAVFREMVAETTLEARHLVQPLFVKEGLNGRTPIESMPGQAQLGLEDLVKEARQVRAAGVPAILLFGIPLKKDAAGSSATDPGGIIPQAVRAIKADVPDLAVICDVCLCEYTDHGHCGVLSKEATERLSCGATEERQEAARPRRRRSVAQSLSPSVARLVDNDATLERLAAMALVCAQAGADMVAPSDMMDGRVEAIREALDAADLVHVPIMSYAVKYASWFYGPFREAAESPPKFGDRRGYQMDVRNTDEALREAAADVEEGADVLLVKPALAYGDIIRRVKQRFGLPVAAYSVSGEFAMVEAAAARGWLDREGVIAEILTGLRRAGADLAITYWAAEAAARLTGGGKG